MVAVVFAVGHHAYAALAAAGIFGLTLMRFPVGRLAVFILGGLALMGGTSGLGPTKILYAGIVVTCFVISWWRVSRSSDEDYRRPAKLAQRASGAMFLAMALAVAVGYSSGHDLSLIGQDAFTYFLIAVSPVIGLDAGMKGSMRAVRTLTVAAGSVAAISWAVWWLARRGSSIAGLERLTMVTSFLGFAVFAIALTLAVNASSRMGSAAWIAFAAAIPIIYIAAGSRSMVVFAAGLLGVVGASRYGRLAPGRFALLAAAIGSAAVAVLPIVILAVPDGDRILQRFTRTLELLENDSIGRDGSVIERSRAYEFTAALFQQSPGVGQGFGHVYPSVSGEASGDLKVDSPLLIFSKFGILGAVAVIGFLALVWLVVRALDGPGELRMGQTVLRVFVWITVFRMAFVAPTEDKGFAYAIALMICFAATASRFPDQFLRSKPRGARAGTTTSATRQRLLARTR
ncbi:hypothetical protein [Demequina sp. SO4-18]|uniref:hypothetical protein n=1 Tax=Demequina sp. SO4-18 TaxID=3401026 RepID=UPI003B5AF52D